MLLKNINPNLIFYLKSRFCTNFARFSSVPKTDEILKQISSKLSCFNLKIGLKLVRNRNLFWIENPAEYLNSCILTNHVAIKNECELHWNSKISVLTSYIFITYIQTESPFPSVYSINLNNFTDARFTKTFCVMGVCPLQLHIRGILTRKSPECKAFNKLKQTFVKQIWYKRIFNPI